MPAGGSRGVATGRRRLRREGLKRAIGRIYSRAADTLYEPIVVRTTFPLLGGDLNDLVLEQGRRAVATSNGRPILDMPIGTAYFTLATARLHHGLVVGADIAEGMVRKARQEAAASNLSNLVTVQADAHHLPFESASFGAILCTNGLQVIPGLDESLTELARVLAPDGKLYVSVVTLPVGGLLPENAAAHLPTMLLSNRDLTSALDRAGLEKTAEKRNRLALLFEAKKRLPSPTG